MMIGLSSQKNPNGSIASKIPPFPSRSRSLNVINVLIVISNVIKLDLVIVPGTEGVCLVDFGMLWQLSVCFQTASFICVVFQDDISFVVLVISQPHQNDIRRVNPHLFPEFSSDVAKPLDSVEAHRLQTAVPQHFDHLSIFLSVLLEHQLSLLRLILVLSTSPILSSLSFILGHILWAAVLLFSVLVVCVVWFSECLQR